MNASQERRLLLAALDFAEADEQVNAHKIRNSPERNMALKMRALAKGRLLRAAGKDRPQKELDLKAAMR